MYMPGIPAGASTRSNASTVLLVGYNVNTTTTRTAPPSPSPYVYIKKITLILATRHPQTNMSAYY